MLLPFSHTGSVGSALRGAWGWWRSASANWLPSSGSIRGRCGTTKRWACCPLPHARAGGYRLYDEDTVGRLAFIVKAKDPGHTLGEKPTPTEGSIPSGMEVKADDQSLLAG